jgi:hypothetical protein
MSASKRPPSGRNWQPDRYADHVKIDESGVPEQLRHLIPYAKYWSIGDDVDRAKLMARTSKARKRALVDAVWPHWAELHAWCESNDWSDEGVIFVNLIVATAEARSEVYPPIPVPPALPTPPVTPEDLKDLEASALGLLQSLKERLEDSSYPGDPEQVAEARARIQELLDRLPPTRNSKPLGTEPGASPNGGPAMRSGNSGPRRGRHR